MQACARLRLFVQRPMNINRTWMLSGNGLMTVAFSTRKRPYRLASHTTITCGGHWRKLAGLLKSSHFAGT
jgi:hypothetical protein